MGFSLGGNFMLRVAAQAREAGLDLARVIAVSPVLEPAETLLALQRGLPGYQRYFVYKWLRSLRKKQAAWPDSYDFRELSRMRDLETMTAELVRCYTDFPTLADYLSGYAITGARLARLEVPASILTSLDDPIIPAAALARLARPAALSLTVSRYGGHCGFFEHLRGAHLARAAHPQAARRRRAGAGSRRRRGRGLAREHLISGARASAPAQRAPRFSSNCTTG